MNAQWAQAQYGKPSTITCKIHQRAKWIASTPMVHVGHDGAQVGEMRTLDEVSYGHSGWGEVVAECGVFDTPSQRCASEAGGTYASLLQSVAARAVLAFERGVGLVCAGGRCGWDGIHSRSGDEEVVVAGEGGDGGAAAYVEGFLDGSLGCKGKVHDICEGEGVIGL